MIYNTIVVIIESDSKYNFSLLSFVAIISIIKGFDCVWGLKGVIASQRLKDCCDPNIFHLLIDEILKLIFLMAWNQRKSVYRSTQEILEMKSEKPNQTKPMARIGSSADLVVRSPEMVFVSMVSNLFDIIITLFSIYYYNLCGSHQMIYYYFDGEYRITSSRRFFSFFSIYLLLDLKSIKYIKKVCFGRTNYAVIVCF